MPAPTAAQLPEASSEPVRRESIIGPVMSSLGWPIVIGLIAFWTLNLSIDEGWITSELLIRYLTAHPVSYVATAMFFVGLASLGLKLLNVSGQILDKNNVKLPAPAALAQRADTSRHLLNDLDEMSLGRQSSYLGSRLRNALEYVDKTESANGLEDELKYLADIDAEKQQESFALTRILIWAIPMLGFLGTVIGISGALGGLSVESDFNTMLSGLKEKLYVAFDTTALALTLSIVLMFAQFVVNRVETQLLDAVDQAATEELSGRFVTYGTNRDPYLASVESMSNRVLDCINDASAQQAEVWNRGLTAIQETTDSTLGRFAEMLADRLSKQLDPVMDEFGIALRNAINDSTTYLDRHGKKLAEAMHSSVELIDQRNQEVMGTLQNNSEALKSVVAIHAEGLKTCLEGSEDVLQQHLHQVQTVMMKTVELVSDQSQQLSLGIENSHELMRSNSDSVNKAIEAANQLMLSHTSHLNEIVQSSSLVMEEHARRISEAVTRSEEIVDQRQEKISQTQESMLKAQTQQSMAISSFTEKLDTLQEVVEQSSSLGQMQSTLSETLTTIERSDTIANEIRGLANLVREQVKSMDQVHLFQAEASEKQIAAVIGQTQQLFQQNESLLGEYQSKINELVETVVQASQQAIEVAPKSAAVDMSQTSEHLQALTMQLVNYNQNMALLNEKLSTSFDLDDLGDKLNQAVTQLMTKPDQADELGPHLETLGPNLQTIVEKLESLQSSFETPTLHQKKFLEQQQKTIDNQSQLLDFCQALEVNNRSTFVDSTNQILDSNHKSAAKTDQLIATVRELAGSLNGLNQSITEQINQAAQSAFHFGQPDTPKRVA